jgi:hypothetical protein
MKKKLGVRGYVQNENRPLRSCSLWVMGVKYFLKGRV